MPATTWCQNHERVACSACCGKDIATHGEYRGTTSISAPTMIEHSARTFYRPLARLPSTDTGPGRNSRQALALLRGTLEAEHRSMSFERRPPLDTAHIEHALLTAPATDRSDVGSRPRRPNQANTPGRLLTANGSDQPMDTGHTRAPQNSVFLAKLQPKNRFDNFNLRTISHVFPWKFGI